MGPITYSIKSGDSNSEEYYKAIRILADEVLTHSNNSLFLITSNYIQYLQTYNLEKIRKTEEYILELISFGVLWRSYAKKALAVKYAPFITLSRMSEWRKKHQLLKPLIDFLRGILLTLFLLPEINDERPIQLPKLKDIDHVCKWFEATGEFKEEAIRFIRWRAYLGIKNSEELHEIFYTIEKFIDWFEIRSEEILGKYTKNVENFLQHPQKNYHWREDRVSCTRTKLEYHLNMIGAELLNRAFRPDFDEVKNKVVLLPGCMRSRPHDKCEAKKVKEGLLCQGCLPKCRVNQLREMGKRHNFEVYIIPHASDLSLWGPSAKRAVRGVIASACVSTLLEGGWELRRYDVPAQCVLLDYCGCKKHWHKEGVITALNVRELKRILN
jgi:uncharacterized protein